LRSARLSKILRMVAPRYHQIEGETPGVPRAPVMYAPRMRQLLPLGCALVVLLGAPGCTDSAPAHPDAVMDAEDDLAMDATESEEPPLVPPDLPRTQTMDEATMHRASCTYRAG